MKEGRDAESLSEDGSASQAAPPRSLQWLNGKSGVLIFISLLVLGLEVQHATKGSSLKAAQLSLGRERLRMLFARECEQTFVGRGVDVTCVTDKQDLIITGPPVNRVFANEFVQTARTHRGLKKLGFTTATFSNGNTMSDRYIERFDVAY